MRDFAVIIGSIMLATGICSPAAGSINQYGSTLVFLGLALVVTVLWADHKTDKRRR